MCLAVTRWTEPSPTGREGTAVVIIVSLSDDREGDHCFYLRPLYNDPLILIPLILISHMRTTRELPPLYATENSSVRGSELLDHLPNPSPGLITTYFSILMEHQP